MISFLKQKASTLIPIKTPSFLLKQILLSYNITLQPSPNNSNPFLLLFIIVLFIHSKILSEV